MNDPELCRKVAHVYLIGGAYGLTEYAFRRATGDNPVSEWNVYVDPEAAQQVFESGLGITALGLEVVTHPKLDLREQDIERLSKSGRPEARFLLDVAAYVRERGFASYCGLIDSMAVRLHSKPSIVTTQRHRVAVETTARSRWVKPSSTSANTSPGNTFRSSTSQSAPIMTACSPCW